MKVKKFYLLLMLCLFSTQTLALFQSGYDYQVITDNLKPTPGCKNKDKAAKQAASDYRFKKLSKVLCQHIGYGWGLGEIEDRGEVICELCEGKPQANNNYQCYVKNVRLKCKLTRRGW